MVNRHRLRHLAALGMSIAIAACTIAVPKSAELHRWWTGFGLVVSHEKFPADCKLCHAGASWNELRDDFVFDHAERTGVPLLGAHANAFCLRCHNDRGPVASFRAQGCAGCHPDVHYGQLGRSCVECHDETTWRVPNARVAHIHTRFPLTGAHMQVACHRCHAGAALTNFRPTDPDCESCHYDDAVAVLNPPHAGFGWLANCDRCHMPTGWKPATIR
jgi:hypothetical protein